MEERRGGCRWDEDKLKLSLHELTERLETIVSNAEGAGARSSPGTPPPEALEQIVKVGRLLGEAIPIAKMNPAAMMLMDLRLAEFRGERVSVSALTVTSGAPHSTALRKIQKLEKEGFIERTGDPSDGRRWYVTLTDEARTMLDAHLDRLVQGLS